MKSPYFLRCPMCQQRFEMTEAYHLGAISYCSDRCRLGAGSKRLTEDLGAGILDGHEASIEQANDGISFPVDDRRQMG